MMIAIVPVATIDSAEIVEAVEYFDVEGVVASDIFDDMRRKGPNIASGGAHALAATHADYRHESEMAYKRDGRCATISLSVSLTLTYQIPRWTDDAAASDSVRNWWGDLLDRIWAHENGHAAIAREGADDLRNALLDVPPARDCDELRNNLRRTMQLVLAKEIEPRQRQFDVENRVRVSVSAR